MESQEQNLNSGHPIKDKEVVDLALSQIHELIKKPEILAREITNMDFIE